MRLDIHHNAFSINPIQNREADFLGILQSYLSYYLDFMHGNADAEVSDLQAVQSFAKNIYLCLLEYMYGQHGAAKEYFNEGLEKIHIEEIIRPLTESVFYRARISQKRLKPDEMFHIPMECRYLVSTRRYSYPGLPCLYLGSSYEVCCEELCCWKSNLNVAQFEYSETKMLNVLDLVFFQDWNFDDLTQKQLSQFLRLWPLVSCCSFTYSNTKDMSFRPDYVLPQLLLEYMIERNADVDIGEKKTIAHGIRYRSVHKSLFSEKNAMWNNYVFPALTDAREGYSETLCKSFIVKCVYRLRELQLSHCSPFRVFLQKFLHNS